MNGTVRSLRPQPLWQRVDQNRVKLAVFIAAFVVGSALLLDIALVLVPGSLLSLVFAEDPDGWFRALAVVVGAAFIGLILLGALASAVQLSNAEDWVRNRFGGRKVSPSEQPALESALHDISLAAGLSAVPALVIIDSPAINAYSLGTVRNPTVGVTRGFLDGLSADEQRAVVATLIARIVAGDVMFGTALAALMGPLKAIRESKTDAAGVAGGCADAGCSDPGCPGGCTHGCSGVGDLDDGCAGVFAIVAFLVLVAVITYVAVVTAAWLVTLWGRVLHRTSYEKADAEGMLLLKDPAPMLSALRKACEASNEFGLSDSSYDGILYASSSGRLGVDARERRRYDRLREVVGIDGLTAQSV